MSWILQRTSRIKLSTTQKNWNFLNFSSICFDFFRWRGCSWAREPNWPSPYKLPYTKLWMLLHIVLAHMVTQLFAHVMLSYLPLLLSPCCWSPPPWIISSHGSSPPVTSFYHCRNAPGPWTNEYLFQDQGQMFSPSFLFSFVYHVLPSLSDSNHIARRNYAA